MTAPAPLISKVLIIEDEPQLHDQMKAFCQANNLVGLKVQVQDLTHVLQTNLDLGAILLSEHVGDTSQSGVGLARQIHQLRPELPIFLRRAQRTDASDLPPADAALFQAVYSMARTENLTSALDTWIFNRSYPTPLVRGITELTMSALSSQFDRVTVTHATPCLVRDRIIHGELFSLIPIESNWCRGFMMLQTQEQPLRDFIRRGKTHFKAETLDFRDINNVLGEITNLAWGAFKNRFTKAEALRGQTSQVPIIVNHQNKYISFGSEDPQLCVRYVITDDHGGPADAIEVLQYFVFNLNWSPENFAENETSAEDLIAAGEVQLF